jgi:hypothetical protein
MPSISLDQQQNKPWVTKQSRNGGQNVQEYMAALAAQKGI